MSKIWEVDFTSFSGTSELAYDNVGTQHLLTYYNIEKVDPLPEFSYRPGITFSIGSSSARYYDLTTPVDSNAFWRRSASYTSRSFVLWVYLPGGVPNSSYYDSAEVPLWVATTTTTTHTDGFLVYGGQTGTARLKINTNVIDGGSLSAGWHLLVATIDVSGNISKFYIDGQYIGSYSGIPSATAATYEIIGQRATSAEGTFSLGYVATYDHILSLSEVVALYNTFLVDSISGDDPYQTFSGTVFGLDGEIVEGSKLYLINTDTDLLVSSDVSTESGIYSLVVPTSGNYVVISVDPPYGGSRSFPMIAASGGVYFT